MSTKHISTNTESLKPCFTAYPVQHKNKSGNYAQNTVTNELLTLRIFFFLLPGSQLSGLLQFSHNIGARHRKALLALVQH